MNNDKKQKAKNRYHEKGGQERAREYYQLNKETIKEKQKKDIKN